MKEARHYQELQRRFFSLIAQRLPLEQAALALQAQDPQMLPISGWIHAPDDAAASARLGIYQHMYFARLRDSLREDFELVGRCLPAGAFDRLAAAYLERYPSDDPSLRYHGRHFPRFLSEVLAAGEPEAEGLRPDLVELARLEWARVDAFDAPSASILQLAEVRGLDPARWGELELRAQPSVRCVQTRFRVGALWQALEADQEPPALQPGAERLLVWRRGWRVFHRPIEALEATALEHLQQGASLATLCVAFVHDGSTPAECAQRAFATLEQWLVDEIVTTDPG